MSYVFYGLFAAFAFALSQIVMKLLSKHSIKDADSMMAYFLLASIGFSTLLLPFTPITMLNTNQILSIILLTIPFVVGYYLFYKGLQEIDASTFAPLFQIQAVIVAILAYIFLGERFPLSNYLWMFFIFLGMVLVTFKENKSKGKFISRGILFILLMQVFHSISNLFVGLALKSLTPIQIIFWENVLIGIMGIIFIIVRRPNFKYKISTTGPFISSLYIAGIGAISLFKAYEQNLTISSVLGLLSAPIVYIFSVVTSKYYPSLLEHHSRKVYIVRGIGLLVILFSVYMIANS